MALENVGQITLGLVLVIASSYYIFDRVARYHYMMDVFIAVLIFGAGLIYLYSHVGKKSGKMDLQVKEVSMGH